MFSLSSCKSTIDLDSYLDEYRYKTQLLFRDTSKNVVSNNDNLYYSGRTEINQLLFSNKEGFYFTSEYRNNQQTIYFYDYQTEKCKEINTIDYRIYMATYNCNLIVVKDDMYYLMDFDTFEVIKCLEDEEERDYAFGINNYKRILNGIDYDYNGKNYSITLDFLLENCEIGDELKKRKNDLTFENIYRFEDEFYVSINFKYSLLLREQLVFKFEDNYFNFIDYYHYSVDNVEYIKFQS